MRPDGSLGAACTLAICRDSCVAIRKAWREGNCFLDPYLFCARLADGIRQKEYISVLQILRARERECEIARPRGREEVAEKQPPRECAA